MVIVDTSVWVSFFKGEEKARTLKDYIIENKAVLHPFVYGELLLGGLSDNSKKALHSLQFCRILDAELIYEFIAKYKFSSSGVGWVDITIITSAMIDNHEVVTFDEKMKRLCKKRKILHSFN